ncbi:MAG: hypothetical protein MJ137_08910 [Clostridia bacterium]|nr:hypothetical protein [Clostridia bacterium]
MSEITEQYSYGVAQKKEGKFLWGRIGLATLYVLVPLITISLLMFIPQLKAFVYLGALVILGDAVLAFFTWRLVDIEYEYSIKTGKVDFTLVQNAFNHRIKKPQTSFMVKDCELIAPFGEQEFRDRYEAFAPETVFCALSSKTASDAYFAIYTDENGKKCAFLFEATNEMLKRCKFYNKNATTVRQMRY